MSDDASSQWLSIALADSLISKFNYHKKIHVLERNLNIQNNSDLAINSKKVKLLGADWLVLGSYQLQNEKIKAHLRIIHTKTSTLNKEAVFEYKGTLQQIFDLEDQMAESINTACSFLLPKEKIKNRFMNNTEAYKLYFLGKIKFEADRLKSALQMVLQAQEKNGGYFFKAHSLEGKIRIALANKHKNENKKIIQKEHLEKFKKDAEAASFALYDLAFALESNGNHQEAIDTYQEFLKWYAAKLRPFRWHQRMTPYLVTEHSQNYYEDIKFSTSNWHRFMQFNPWVNKKGMLYYVTEKEGDNQELICMKTKNAKVLWKVPIKWEKSAKEKDNTWRSLIVRDKYLYFTSVRKLRIFDRYKGILIADIPLPSTGRKESLILPKVITFEKKNQVIVSLLAEGLNQNKYAFGGSILSINLKSFDIDWVHTIESSTSQIIKVLGFQGHLYFLNEGILSKLESKENGEYHIESLGENITNIWPGQDHLLVRQKRDKNHTSYNKYSKGPSNSSKWETLRQKIFHNYMNRKPLKNMNQYATPIVDRQTGFYKLIPTQYLLPYTNMKGIGCFCAEHDSWVSLEGNQIVLFNHNMIYNKIDTRDGSLLWRYYLPRSGQGVEMIEDMILTRKGFKNVSCINTKLSGYEYLNVEAHIGISRCFFALKKYKKSLTSINEALKSDASNLKAHSQKAKISIALQNKVALAKAYDAILTFCNNNDKRYKNALQWMKKNLGLLKRVTIPNISDSILQNSILWYSIENGNGQKDIFSYDLQSLTTKPFKSPVEISSWSLHGNKIITTNTKQNKTTILDLEANKIISLPHSKKNSDDLEKAKSIKILSSNIVGNMALISYEYEKKYFIEISDIDLKKEIWSFTRNTAFLFTFDNEKIFILGKQNHSGVRSLVAYNINDGELLWENNNTFKQKSNNLDDFQLLASAKHLFLSHKGFKATGQNAFSSIVALINKRTGFIRMDKTIPFLIEMMSMRKGLVYLTLKKFGQKRRTTILKDLFKSKKLNGDHTQELTDNDIYHFFSVNETKSQLFKGFKKDSNLSSILIKDFPEFEKSFDFKAQNLKIFLNKIYHDKIKRDRLIKLAFKHSKSIHDPDIRFYANRKGLSENEKNLILRLIFAEIFHIRDHSSQGIFSFWGKPLLNVEGFENDLVFGLRGYVTSGFILADRKTNQILQDLDTFETEYVK